MNLSEDSHTPSDGSVRIEAPSEDIKLGPGQYSSPVIFSEDMYSLFIQEKSEEFAFYSLPKTAILIEIREIIYNIIKGIRSPINVAANALRIYADTRSNIRAIVSIAITTDRGI